MKGFFFDNQYPAVAPEGEIPDMPRHEDTEAAGFQIFASAWALNAFSTTLFQEVDLAYTLIGQDLNITTSELNIGLPGISGHYGPDQFVDIAINLTSVQEITTRKDDNTVSAMSAANVKFYVHKTDGTKELAVDIDGQQMYTNFTVLIFGDAVAGNVTAVSVGKVKQNSCTFGKIPLTTEKFFLNKIINTFLPSINEFLNSKRLILPTELFGIFTLSDLVIKYYDYYVMIGATPTFIPMFTSENSGFVFDPTVKANPAFMPKKDYFKQINESFLQ